MGKALKKTTRSKSRRKKPGRIAPKKTAKKTNRKSQPVEDERSWARETGAVFLFCFAIFLGLALYSELSQQDLPQAENLMGRLGAHTAGALLWLLGWCSLVVVVWAFLLSRTVWTDGMPTQSESRLSLVGSIVASGVMTTSCAVLASVLFGKAGGGTLGSQIAIPMIDYLNEAGTLLICIGVFLLSIGISTGVGATELVELVSKCVGGGVSILGDSLYLLGELARASYSLLKGSVLFLGHSLASIFGFAVDAARENISERREAREAEYGEEQEYEEHFKTELRGKTTSDVNDYQDIELEDEGHDEAVGELELPPKRDSELLISRRKFAEEAIARRGLRGKKKEEEKRKAQKRSQLNKHYTCPPLDLLVSGESNVATGPQDKELISNSKRLETALKNFRITGRVLEVHPGPVVTLYQFEPGAGIKVNRIVNLADDLALALKVGSVRVYAPVPGKGTVGIEVPNTEREIVRLKDVLSAEEYQTRKAPLLLSLGKNTFGEPFFGDLSKMPHLLIAGATGTGKSVCINSILMSLLYRNSPEDLRLIMIDPKMLELSIYEDIPHQIAPVVTQPKRARGVLCWAVEEMEKRYRLMKDAGVRNISMYNASLKQNDEETITKKKKDVVIRLEEKDVVATGSPYEGLDRKVDAMNDELDFGGGAEPLPHIVIVVDELADLMLTVGREIEELLTRLAQKARAAGIHLILATQRPSVNVITGLIKANFPARISFKVASKIDSRTILDGSGAERLLGQGDCLYLSPGVGRVQRLHSPFVSDKEVNDVVAFIRTQGSPQYDESIEKMIRKLEESEAGSGGSGGGDDDYDEFYDRAVSLVVEEGKASTSMVQRAFRIGYNRAARILETMERDGVVGPADGSKPRQVLLGNPENY